MCKSSPDIIRHMTANADKPPPHKTRRVVFMIDEELTIRAIRKSRQFGSLAAVVRALLRAWVEGRITLTPDSIARENERALRQKTVDKSSGE